MKMCESRVEKTKDLAGSLKNEYHEYENMIFFSRIRDAPDHTLALNIVRLATSNTHEYA
jgi:hypothetical protein